MSIPRLLLFSLLISICIAPVAAQSSHDKNPISSPPMLTPPQSAQPGIRVDQFQMPMHLDELNLSRTRPGNVLSSEYKSKLLAPEFRGWQVAAERPNIENLADILKLKARMPSGFPRQLATLAANDTVCFSMRSYRFTRDDPDSDSMTPAGHSTCQPATRFQVRGARDSREKVPR
jgi:hypothetical protein